MRQLEREVSALENRECARCATRDETERVEREEARDARSDTESVAEAPAHAALAQVTLLKEQVERAEAQLQV